LISKDELEKEKQLLQDLLVGTMDSEGYKVDDVSFTEGSKRYNLVSPYTGLEISVNIQIKNKITI
jgi:hypothetical protein